MGRQAHATNPQGVDRDDAAVLVPDILQRESYPPDRAYKILLHDYCGHPFQFELAVELAARGHVVEHRYCASNPTTPQGVDVSTRVSERFESRGIGLPKPIEKGAFLERFLLERRYGAELAAAIDNSMPDIALLANTPIDSLGPALAAARRVGATAVIWVQDLLGEAALRVLPGKIGPLGKVVGHAYRRREGRLLSDADFLIAITDDFRTAFRRAGISSDRWVEIPNWGPLDRVQPREKVNPWSVEHGVSDKLVLLYSGNLGFKHNPNLLLALAESLRHRQDAVVIVNSQGDAADWLRLEAARRGITAQLRVNGFQPFERISDVLGAADVLLAVLEPDAGVFSVPSKVLSNLCAGRPQVLAVPRENLAAKIVEETGAGLVCEPRDEQAFVTAVLTLLGDAALMKRMGKNARSYAEGNFRINRIAERFEAAFGLAMQNHRNQAK